MRKSKSAKPGAKCRREDELLNLGEAAQRLGVSRAFVRDQLWRHRLTVVRFGRLLRIPPETLDKIIKLGRRPFTPHVAGGDR